MQVLNLSKLFVTKGRRKRRRRRRGRRRRRRRRRRSRRRRRRRPLLELILMVPHSLQESIERIDATDT